jgi:hypothetical protein
MNGGAVSSRRLEQSAGGELAPMSIPPLVDRPGSSDGAGGAARRRKMRFLSMIRVDENVGQVPSEQLMHDMGKLIDDMTREGVLVQTAGLRPTAEGTRVRLRQGHLSTVDGPFIETKEVVGGFAILEADSMQTAIELTKRFLRVHGNEWDIECEVRELDGPEAGRDV